MSCDERLIDSILIKVEKPGRYTGGEYNTPDMDKPCKVRVCTCFPDLYEVGMSNLGIRILYHMLNDQKDIVAERCFAPHIDLANELRNNGLSLFSLETKRPLIEFDIIGISVQYEMLYSNILYMLDLANIPFFSKDRGEDYPIIIGGGPCSVNPEPFAPFFDIIVIGEGEEAMLELTQLYIELKEKGYSKKEYLTRAAAVRRVYVPELVETYDKGKFVVVKGKGIVKQAYLKDFENAYFPTAILVPNIEAVHDRPVLELFRGCPNGCRFCQAGFYYRPIRMRSLDKIVKQGERTIKETGFDELSLASLSTSDYKYIEELVKSLYAMCESKGVNLSLPSLRMDSFKGDIAIKSRLCSLTFAPEAGTQRLRDIINKNITDNDIENTLREAFRMGYSSVKLYFMIGLPTERMEDLDGIRDMVLKIKNIYHDEVKGKPLNINISNAVFVPKPLTPFQWERKISYDEIKQRQEYMRSILKIKGVHLSWHDIRTSELETAFARGDRRLAQVIVNAYNSGAKFDSWTEHLKYDVWMGAFKSAGVDINNYLEEIPLEQSLPWDFIDFYVSKDYLMKERLSAYSDKTVNSCKSGCNACFSEDMECDL